MTTITNLSPEAGGAAGPVPVTPYLEPSRGGVVVAGQAGGREGVQVELHAAGGELVGTGVFSQEQLLREGWFGGYGLCRHFPQVEFTSAAGPLHFERATVSVGDEEDREAVEELGLSALTGRMPPTPAGDFWGEALLYRSASDREPAARCNFLQQPRPTRLNFDRSDGAEVAAGLRRVVWLLGPPIEGAADPAGRPFRLSDDPVLAYLLALHWVSQLDSYIQSGGRSTRRELPVEVTNVFSGELPHVSASEGDHPAPAEHTAPAVATGGDGSCAEEFYAQRWGMSLPTREKEAV